MARIHRGKGEAWLRGGQTFSHNVDMIMEVLGRLVILCLIWGMVCIWMGNNSSSDLEQEYGIQGVQAALFDKLGHPLPDKLSIKGLDGVERTYKNSDVPKLTWLQPYAKSYYRKLRKALLMWGLGVFAVFAITTAWFIHSGEEKLKARQIRGQKVVAVGDLMREIYEFNDAKRAAENNPDYMAAKIVGVPLPYGTESQHVFAAGSPGSGKSQAIHTLIESARERGDRAIIYDPELDYIRAHYNPKTDLILNPYDARSVGWSPFNDATEMNELMKLAACLWKDPPSGDPYWSEASRQVFVWATYQFKEQFPGATLQDLLQLFFGPFELVEWLVQGTPAGAHLSGGGGRVASIKSVVMTGLNSLTHLSGDNSTFSIREWVNAPRSQGGFLFLSAPETHMDSLRPLLSFWVELVVGALLSRPEDNRPPTWVFLDEFASLGQIDSLATGPVRLRKYNGGMVLGMQQYSQLQDIYGHETATTIIGQCAHKLILRCQDPDTAKFMSDQLGRAQIRRVDESISFGANSQRDGVNINAREELEPIALPEDLMNQPQLQGFIKVASAREGEAFPAATLKFKYRPRPKIAEGIIAPTGDTPTRIFLAALRESREWMRQAEHSREEGETQRDRLEEPADIAATEFDPLTGELIEPDAPVTEPADETEDPAPTDQQTGADEGGLRMATRDDGMVRGEGTTLEEAAATEVALPEMASKGNLDRTSRLAVDAYRSRLDQQNHQRAFMQLYDRVRRDMEQGNSLNGIAVWKSKEGARKGPEEAWPFVSKDRPDREDNEGPEPTWTPQS